MKARFSFGDAFAAPFVLLLRRPLYLLVWGLLMMALTVATYSLMVPFFAAMPFGGGSEAAFEAYVQEATRFSAAINGMNVLMYLVMLMTWTAAGRAVLSPGRGDRFLFLRIGMDEVRVAVVMIAVFVGWYLALLVLVLLGAGIGLLLWAANEQAAVLTVLIYGLAVAVASIWALVRVSLIAPASLILKQFAFAEGWALARGQVWKLIGLNILVWLVYVVGMILVYALVGGILVAGFLGQGLEWPDPVSTGADLVPLLQPMIVPGLLALIPMSLGFGWVMGLYAAPGIVAARQLLDGAPIVEDGRGPHTIEAV